MILFHPFSFRSARDQCSLEMLRPWTPGIIGMGLGMEGTCQGDWVTFLVNW